MFSDIKAMLFVLHSRSGIFCIQGQVSLEQGTEEWIGQCKIKYLNNYIKSWWLISIKLHGKKLNALQIL